MVVGEFGAQLPMADRIGIFQAIYDEILDAATDGLPAAGGSSARPSEYVIAFLMEAEGVQGTAEFPCLNRLSGASRRQPRGLQRSFHNTPLLMQNMVQTLFPQ